MTRRTLLGALKCAFRELRRELDTILAIFAAGWAGDGLVEREEMSLSNRILDKFEVERLVCEASAHGLLVL